MKSVVLMVFAFLLSTPALAGVQAFNTSNVNLGVFNQVKCSTGLTCTKVGTKLNIVSSPSLTATLTLQSNEIITNLTDDTVSVQSEDNNTTLQVLGYEAKTSVLELWADQGDDAADKWSLTADTSGVLTFAQAGAAADIKMTAFEATDAKLTLQADESDDNGDDWEFKNAASGNALTISNDTSGSQVAKITVAASDGDLTLTGGVTGDGGDSLSGFLQAQVASTTASLTAAQCGSTIVSNSADVQVLPEASTVLGCRYTFVCGTADDYDINPADGTDQIGPALNSVAGGTGAAITPAAGDAIRCTDIGSSITLEAVGNDLWAPIGVGNGAWTDIN